MLAGFRHYSFPFQEIHGNMALCHYIWYEDWKCAECCQGDRCNYYVTVSLNINQYELQAGIKLTLICCLGPHPL